MGILRYAFNNNLAVAARGEYFSDKNGVIFGTGTTHGFQVLGLSLNIDWAISDQAMWRVEGRLFKSEDPIFFKEGKLSDSNASLTTSIAVSF